MTHQQFLDKLWEKNEHYRNGDFWVLGEYVGDNAQILLGTDYGDCSMRVWELYRGSKPTIKSSVNKHSYFESLLSSCNEHYKNKHFVLASKYEDTRIKIRTKDKFGVCEVLPNQLLQGSKPTIRTSIDPTSYFKNKCLDKFGEDNDDLSQVEYVNSKTKIKVIDEFGEYWITPDKYLLGNRSMKSRNKKISKSLLADPVKIFDKIRELHPELEIIDTSNYKGYKQKIEVLTQFGVCKSKISHLLRGHKPTVLSAIDKTSYFINQAKEVHGDKYDYSLVEFKNYKTKVKIISEYGVFEQGPQSHLSGSGCPVEANKAIPEKNCGWSHSNWAEGGRESKRFESFKVYFLECFNDDRSEVFYKIGKTFTPLKKRYKSKYQMPYNYKVVGVIEGTDGKEISKLERKYQKMHKDYKYRPKKDFGGYLECFSKLIYI